MLTKIISFCSKDSSKETAFIYNPTPSLSLTAQKQRLPIAKNRDDVSRVIHNLTLSAHTDASDLRRQSPLLKLVKRVCHIGEVIL